MDHKFELTCQQKISFLERSRSFVALPNRHYYGRGTPPKNASRPRRQEFLDLKVTIRLIMLTVINAEFIFSFVL